MRSKGYFVSPCLLKAAGVVIVLLSVREERDTQEER
jgi:hypothetical protein